MQLATGRRSVPRGQLFRVLPAVHNLADKSSEFCSCRNSRSTRPKEFDKSWLKNAIAENVDEAGIDVEMTPE